MEGFFSLPVWGVIFGGAYFRNFTVYMTCPFKMLTFTSLGGAGASCFLASWSSSFFFLTELSGGVLPELCYYTLRLVLFCKTNLVEMRTPMMTLLMKGLCPFNYGKQ